MSAKFEDGEGGTTGSLDFSGDGVVDELPHGWSRTSIQFVATGNALGNEAENVISVGLILSLTTEDPSSPYEISLQLGQLSIHPTPSTTTVPYKSRILWADCELQTSTPPQSDNSAAKSLLAVSWDTSIYFTSNATINPLHIEDPNPPWVLDRSPRWYPQFQYFNIYALNRAKDSGGATGWRPEDAKFIGTSGYDGIRNKLVVDWNALPAQLRERPLRVYVQGVTETGEILPWDRCAFVDWF